GEGPPAAGHLDVVLRRQQRLRGERGVDEREPLLLDRPGSRLDPDARVGGALAPRAAAVEDVVRRTVPERAWGDGGGAHARRIARLGAAHARSPDPEVGTRRADTGRARTARRERIEAPPEAPARADHVVRDVGRREDRERVERIGGLEEGEE